MAKRKKITMAGVRALVRAAVLWDSMHGTGARAVGATQRVKDVDRASALQRLCRKADARRIRHADGRGSSARSAGIARRYRRDKHTHTAVPTVRTFAPVSLADCTEQRKLATLQAHAWDMNRFILPTFGEHHVIAVTVKDVHGWLYDLSVRRVASANRAQPVLSSMMKHAEAL